MGYFTSWFVFLWILYTFRHGRRSKATGACERRIGGVEIHRHAALLIAFLFPFQANSKRTADRMTQTFSLIQG